MTIDERFARIEHVTAGLDEQFRREREENRELWRDTEKRLAAANDAITRLAEASREADRRLGQRMDQLAEEFRAADAVLEERIASLVSAMGEVLSKLPKN